MDLKTVIKSQTKILNRFVKASKFKKNLQISSYLDSKKNCYKSNRKI